MNVCGYWVKHLKCGYMGIMKTASVAQRKFNFAKLQKFHTLFLISQGAKMNECN